MADLPLDVHVPNSSAGTPSTTASLVLGGSSLTHSASLTSEDGDVNLVMSREDRQRLGDAIEDGALSAFPIQPLSVGSHGATRVSFHPTGDPNTTEVTVRHAFTARFAEGQNFANEGQYNADDGPPLPPPSARSSSSLLDTPPDLPGLESLVLHPRTMTFRKNLAHLKPALPRVPLPVDPLPQRHPLELDPKHVLVGPRIAVGGFSEVFICKYQGSLAAAKLLLNLSPKGRDAFLREVDVLATLRHPNLLLFQGFVLSPYLGIVTEYMARGSLFKVMRASAEGPLPLRLVRTVAVQVARGMASLHSRPQPLLHLDLKSPNILLDDKWRVKIADFGLARLKVHAHVTPGAPSGTPEWMAPEVLRSEPYAEGADVYSYGVVLWEMLTGQQPWEGLLPVQVVGAVGFQGKTLPPPATGDPFLARVCESCLSQLPGARPSFDAILQELEQEFAPSGYSKLSHSLSAAGMHLQAQGEGRDSGMRTGSTMQRGSYEEGARPTTSSTRPSFSLLSSAAGGVRGSRGDASLRSSFEGVGEGRSLDAEAGEEAGGVGAPAPGRASPRSPLKSLHPQGSMTNASPFAQ
uniref:Protein kinase domain-containing protein n=1 Tax=Auxenochlorella protothecoides TaxID=3075 RepID=A0A1D1ZVD3_AUXPR